MTLRCIARISSLTTTSQPNSSLSHLWQDLKNWSWPLSVPTWYHIWQVGFLVFLAQVSILLWISTAWNIQRVNWPHVAVSIKDSTCRPGRWVVCWAIRGYRRRKMHVHTQGLVGDPVRIVSGTFWLLAFLSTATSDTELQLTISLGFQLYTSSTAEQIGHISSSST